MTSSVPAQTVYEYEGDGATLEFSFPLRFLDNAELLVYVDDVLQVIGTHYSLDGTGAVSGDTVTFEELEVPADGSVVRLVRQTSSKQTVDLMDSARTPGDTLELQLDRLAMVGQDHDHRIDALEAVADDLDDAVDDAEASATAAAASATAAATSATAAATAETNAETAETNAETAQALAEAWASEDEDVEVTTGEYSAKHWAAKAAGSASAVTSVNSQTGAVVLDADDIDDASTTNKFATAAQLALADAALQPGDADASGFGFVIDEDDMSSDSATKVPTQQSVKAYVDNNAGGVSSEALSAMQFDNRVQAIYLAEATGDVLFLGPDGSALHDGFDVLTYVDDATATGLDTSEAGVIKPAAASAGGLISQAEGTIIGTYLTRSGAPFDGTTAQAASAGAVDTTGVSGARYCGKDYGAGNEKVVTGIKTWGATDAGYINGGASTNVSIVLKASNTDPTTTSWTGDTIATITTFANSAAANAKESLDNANATAYRYVWAQITIATTTNKTLAEVEFYEAAGEGDLSVPSEVITAATQPDWIRMALRMEDAASIVLNTDVFVDFSRDGGSTWTTATLVEAYIQPDDVRVLDTGEVDVSAQPAGTSLHWRIRTDNDVTPKFLGYAFWAGEAS